MGRPDAHRCRTHAVRPGGRDRRDRGPRHWSRGRRTAELHGRGAAHRHARAEPKAESHRDRGRQRHARDAGCRFPRRHPGVALPRRASDHTADRAKRSAGLGGGRRATERRGTAQRILRLAAADHPTHPVDAHRDPTKETMTTTDNDVQIAAEPAGKTTFKVTVSLDGNVLYVDTLNPSNAAARKKFADSVTARFSGLDANLLDAQLANLAAGGAAVAAPDDHPQEVDVSRVVRPELFHTIDVSGITVPVLLDAAGELVPRWQTHLRWADGRREVIATPDRLKLPGGSPLYVPPDPGEPPDSDPPAWSADSPRDWPAPAPSRPRLARRGRPPGPRAGVPERLQPHRAVSRVPAGGRRRHDRDTRPVGGVHLPVPGVGRGPVPVPRRPDGLGENPRPRRAAAAR